MEYVKHKNDGFVVLLNTLGLLGITISLWVAFFYQFQYHELPCPLCLLQRGGLIIAGIAFMLNMFRKICYSHYCMVILACLGTGSVGTRQMLLHIMPNDPGYGSLFLGLHFYTWVYITAILLILGVMGMMVLGEITADFARLPSFPFLKKIVGFLFVLTIFANMVSTFLECGFEECPSDPIKYMMLFK